MSNSDDQQLLTAMAGGDAGAFEHVYRTYKDDLLTATLFLLKGERAAAEDVLHDVFVAVAGRAGDIELTGTLRNYLLTSCLNRARDLLRRKNRESPSANSNSQTSIVSNPPHEAQSSELERLAEALQALPDEQREVVTLHLHGALKFREIAEMLGISINTVQSRYRYALAALRKQLEHQATHED